MRKKQFSKRKTRTRGRVRSKIHGTAERPRLCVFRSNRHIYAQVINDDLGHTLASASSKDEAIEAGRKPTDCATTVGQLVAERAKAAGVERVVFDRNVYRFHGRVRALADGAREGGLAF